MIWDSKDRRYEDERGRSLTPAEVRREIESFIDSERERVQSESTRLFAGLTTVSEFFAFMRQKVTAWHGVAGQIAYGGEDEMNGERWKRINEKIISELEYLNEFEQAVENSFGAVEAIADEVAKSVPLEMESAVRVSVAEALLRSAPSTVENIVRQIVRDALEKAA